MCGDDVVKQTEDAVQAVRDAAEAVKGNAPWLCQARRGLQDVERRLHAEACAGMCSGECGCANGEHQCRCRQKP